MLVFLRGGKGLKSFANISVCSPAYWGVNISIVIVVFFAAYLIRNFLLRWDLQKKEIILKYGVEE